MNFKRICITGGAGFVGSNLAVRLREALPACDVLAVDSLKRRGSELTLPRLHAHGVTFVHGDIRCPEDLSALPEFDVLLDASAEPSVHAGTNGSGRYLLNTNLVGSINCLEIARERGAAFMLLSTSRVYPIELLNGLSFSEEATRFVWNDGQALPGCSRKGVTEQFPLEGARSLYGASKLSSELLLQEYVYSYGVRGIINRCGILTGPWQMGKVDQGVVTLWVARHHYQIPIRYIGFGGTGKQVRDMLHVDDLFDLMCAQLKRLDLWDGGVYNVGGGLDISASLCELTQKCQALTGNTVPIDAEPQTSPVDIRIYLTDAQRAQNTFDWTPNRSVDDILTDIHAWLTDNQDQLNPIFAG